MPAGLSLNSTTGAISGAPTVNQAATTYTVTASNTGGSTTTTISITVNDLAPTMLTYTQGTVLLVTGTALTADSPSNAGGIITSYSVGTALPAGLTLNTTTGVITGTPTAATASANYVITGKNATGSTTATVNITVIAPNPSNANATWTYISGVILPQCTGCHNSTAVAPVDDLSSYSAVMNVVVASNPMNSLFFTYLAPGSPEPMPLGGQALPAAEQQAVFDWINNGAIGPSPTPTPTPTPSMTACSSTGMNSTIAGCGSMLVPTTWAVWTRIVKVLSAAGVDSEQGNFGTTLIQLFTSLPNSANPTIATGYSQIPLLVYSACSDANPSFYNVNTSTSVAANSTALVNAGVAMLNAHVGNLAAAGTSLNTQVAAVFTTLVNADISAGATTQMTFVSVCTTANTFGVEMTGF